MPHQDSEPDKSKFLTEASIRRGDEKCKPLVVALAGNPNSGKTTIFNNLTGARQHVGNWPGVTVERKEGACRFGDRPVKVVDLPGTYSLSAYSMEEIVARDFIVDEKPDVVIDVVDASSLERNLYLATQIKELGPRLIIALNMADVAESRGMKIDMERLQNLMGVPVIPTVGSKNRGTKELLQAALDVMDGRLELPERPVRYGKEIEEALARLEAAMPDDEPPQVRRWHALKLLENDDKQLSDSLKARFGPRLDAALEQSVRHLRTVFDDDPDTLVADGRYGYIAGLVRKAVEKPPVDRVTATDRIDSVLANRALGLPIFAFMMYMVFELTFRIGAPFMDLVEGGFDVLGEWVEPLLVSVPLIQSLVVDGVIGGVGGVLVFLPNILLLFLAIAFLEDTGYMARAAFLVDKLMHKIGLHGKSFIPMLIGFGCSVPGVMATRTLDNDRDRLTTMLVVPLMSCGARLPVYILLAGAFFPPAQAGKVIFVVYLIGILMAVIVAKLLRSLVFKGAMSPFVMELPPYRMPTPKGILIHMWERAWLYVKKAGTVILALSIVIWFLLTFPSATEYSEDYEGRLQNLEQRIEVLSAEPGAESELEALMQESEELQGLMASEELQQSYAGRIGKVVEPAIAPLGFDWRIGISAIAGFAAKEVVVSTLGTLYSIDAESESESLTQALRDDESFNPLVAFTLMIFVLLTYPCVAAVVVIGREGGWRWAVFSMVYHTVLAWVVSFAVYQGGLLLGIGV